jgi:CheY-like chemotaxis protein
MTDGTNPKLAEILLIEDSPTDALLAAEALESARVCNRLNVVTNGVEAMAYLRREGRYADAQRPDLILLDLNLPKMDGREVLKEIKSDYSLRFIPVVVLTTSKAEADVVQAYGLYANCYIVKPVDFEQFAESVAALGRFWFAIVTLPPEI